MVVARSSAQLRGVTGDAQPIVKDLHRGGGEANLHLLPDQLVGNAVEVSLGGDVVIQLDLQLAPLADLVTLGRKGAQGGLVEGGEQAGPGAFAFAEGLCC